MLTKIKILKILRRLYLILNPTKKINCEHDPDKISKTIYEALESKNPCMIGRFGSNELTCLSNYQGVLHNNKKYVRFILNKIPPWWWEKKIILQMQNCGGFFPPTINKIESFCKLLLKDIKQVDVLGSWLSQENYFEEELKNTKKVKFIYLDPFWAKKPWTKSLENKKILVIHPFVETIKNQYKKRNKLFKNKYILPDFELKTIKSVQSIAGNKTPFKDWFEALESMKSKMDRIDYDICLIGCGTYGFHLAAHAKRKGKKSVHMGGSLQLLFGIKGKRWENPKYGKKDGLNYKSLFNESWTRANSEETPKKSKIVENSCYW